MRKIIFILLSLCSLALAQNYSIRNYGVDDGLQQFQVISAAQDQQGCIWFGTYGSGVGKYDGNSFKFITTTDGLIDNTINYVYKDWQNDLWFATENGISLWKEGQFINYNTDQGLISGQVNWIVQADTLVIWIGTEFGLSKFEDGNFSNFTKKEGLTSNRVLTLYYESADKKLYIGTDAGLAVMDVDGKISKIKDFVKSGLVILDIIQDSEQRILTATSAGLYILKNGALKPYFKNNNKQFGSIQSLHLDKQNRLWLGTGSGAYCLDNNEIHAINTENGLANNTIWQTLEDEEENIWILTDIGLSKFFRNQFPLYTKVLGEEMKLVWCGWEKAPGIIWLVNSNHLYELEKKTGKMKKLSPFSFTELPFPFFEDRRGDLWFGANYKVFQYKNNEFVDVSEKANLPSLVVMAIYEDRAGNIWVGTQNRGVLKIDSEFNVRFISSKDGLLNNSVNDIKQDQWGRMYFATESGITVFQNQILHNLTKKHGLTNRSVMALNFDETDGLWAATYGGGINYIKAPHDTLKMEIMPIGISSGLTNEYCLTQIYDDFGNLWVGTNNGVNRIDIRHFLKSGEISVQGFEKHSGFAGIECNQGSFFKDHQGNLWVGTISGLSYFNPAKISRNNIPPKLSIRNFQLFHQDLEKYDLKHFTDYNPAGNPLILEHDQNNVTFDFVGVSLSAPEVVEYSYILEGFDQEWHSIGNKNEVNYSLLPPGEFEFKVMAKNNHNIESVYPVSYAFSIKKPFWMQWWFYLVLVLIFVLIILLITKMRTHSLTQTKIMLEGEVNKRTKQLRAQQLQISRINEELEERVEQRSQALMLANDNLRKEIRERRMAEEQIKSSLTEKEVLIKEIHHRVKNNLQIISSLLYLQSRNVVDEETTALFRDSQNRVKSIALIHENLYQSKDLANIDLAEYLQHLTGHLISTYKNDVRINLNFDSGKFLLNLEKAIPCGLMINELLTNAFKYAFPDEKRPDSPIIEITGSFPENGWMQLSVADNGVGFPENKDLSNSKSLGLRLVNSLIDQLEGKLEMSVSNGTEFKIIFPNNGVHGEKN